MPFNTFANRVDPDQAAILRASCTRAAWSGSTLFAYGNMILYDLTLVDLCLFDLILYVPSTIFQLNRVLLG